MQLPGCQSHLTSFTWDKTGQRLASCVATGHLILWRIEFHQNEVRPCCVAVLEGGHTRGRPLYGAKYCGDEEEMILTWGVDGKLCLWDSHSQDQIHKPLDTLISRPEYPLYAVDITKNDNDDVVHSCSDEDNSNNNVKNNKLISRIAIAGGRDGGVLGVPFYIYDIFNTHSDHEKKS